MGNYPEIIALTTATVTLVIVVVMVALTWFLREARKSEYDTERSRAELSYLRTELEHRLSEINSRLTATQERFSDVNHLLLSSQRFEKDPSLTVEKINLSNFLKSAGVSERDLEIEQKLVFVLTPFHEDENETFVNIKEVCGSLGLQCIRGDENKASGDILTHIIKYIVRSRLIIANVNGRNPNVYYELGIAHALDRPVLIIAQSDQPVSFDLVRQRILIYRQYDDLRENLTVAISRMVLHEAV